jgi:hypothetical protein
VFVSMKTKACMYGSGLETNTFKQSMSTCILPKWTLVHLTKVIWKYRIPEKVRIFMWLVAQKTILIKDNMIKKRW